MNRVSESIVAIAIVGLRMYYEIHGTGKPLVLPHGWFSTIETDFGKIIPAFAKTRQVIAIGRDKLAALRNYR